MCARDRFESRGTAPLWHFLVEAHRAARAAKRAFPCAVPVREGLLKAGTYVQPLFFASLARHGNESSTRRICFHERLLPSVFPFRVSMLTKDPRTPHRTRLPALMISSLSARCLSSGSQEGPKGRRGAGGAGSCPPEALKQWETELGVALGAQSISRLSQRLSPGHRLETGWKEKEAEKYVISRTRKKSQPP